MSWISTLRTSAEDLGTLAENEPPTGSERPERIAKEVGKRQWAILAVMLVWQTRRFFHNEAEGMISSLLESGKHSTGRDKQ